MTSSKALLVAGLMLAGGMVQAQKTQSTDEAPAPAPSVASQSLPEGLYDCWIGNMNLGQIEMVGGQYRGPAHDGAFEGASQPFTTDGPTITWGGTLGGISAAGTIVSTVVMGEADGTVDGFDVMIENSTSGNFQTITCYAPS